MSGPGAGRGSGSPALRGTRYFSTIPVMPCDCSHAATSVPSRSHARFQYPPPGQTMKAAPVFFFLEGRKTVMVGRVTPVIQVAVFVGASDGSRTRSGAIGPYC